jgi:hypothetical protein
LERTRMSFSRAVFAPWSLDAVLCSIGSDTCRYSTERALRSQRYLKF